MSVPNYSNALKEHQHMYLQNKYTKWYFSIIANSKANQCHSMYTEVHHIIPKSLGGSNEITNLVRLTAKEHYICHLLLTKMVGDKESIRKMWYASYMMVRGQRRHRPSARMYEVLRQNMINANKDRPGPNLGRNMSEEQKLKIGASLKGKHTGKKTDEHKQKMQKPKSEDHKRNLSAARTGKSWGYKHSSDTKEKMSSWQKGISKPTMQCIYCGKNVSFLNHSRWHGNKCKNKP